MCGVERKRPLGRSRLRWEFNVELDVKIVEWGVVDWIHLTQDRNKWRAVVNTVMKLEIHKMLEISPLAEELSASPRGL